MAGDPNTTADKTTIYKMVPMVSHGQELSDLVRATAQGYQLTHVGDAAYTLKRDVTDAE